MKRSEIYLQDDRFVDRVNNVLRKHGNAPAGYVKLEERNGILIPVQRRRFAIATPLRGFVYALGILFALKAFLLFSIGIAPYTTRIATLDGGSVVEQIAGWLMQPDPASLWIAAQAHMLLQ